MSARRKVRERVGRSSDAATLKCRTPCPELQLLILTRLKELGGCCLSSKDIVVLTECEDGYVRSIINRLLSMRAIVKTGQGYGLGDVGVALLSRLIDILSKEGLNS